MTSRRLIQAIESHFVHRFNRPACYLPSGRLGIYAACCVLFPPGSRVVLSPVTDDIVLFCLLAAGIKPIFIDIDPKSGGLLANRIPEAVSMGATGVITSNLYGIPDDAKAIREICDRSGLLLIEDCAHAMVSTVDGKPVGAFGDIAIFSMNKHVGFRGGVLTGRSQARVNAIRQYAETYVKRPSFLTSLLESCWIALSKPLDQIPNVKQLIKTILGPVRAILPNEDEEEKHLPLRVGHRVPVGAHDFDGFEERKPFGTFDHFIKVDNPAYRVIPSWINLLYTLKSLREMESKADFYQKAADRVDHRLRLKVEQAEPLTGTAAGFFKIPFFADADLGHDRNLLALGIHLSHIYSPAFPHYLPSQLYINLARDEATIQKWSRNILPIPTNDLKKATAYFLHNRHDNNDYQSSGSPC
jgi:hypothetical protein